MRTFTKADPSPLEAAGLRWLAEAGARVPRIVEEGPQRLVLQRIPQGRLDAAGEEDLGRMLARMHDSGAARFGTLPAPGRFLVGRLEVPQRESDDWAEHYLHVLCLPPARDVGLEREVAQVAVDAPDEPPARLHGDLWAGNVLADAEGHPWLIDPSAYGGHREVDLAMLALFGEAARSIAAYEELTPLAEGWQERVGLYQLLPLLVHAALFGGSYVQSAERMARRYAG